MRRSIWALVIAVPLVILLATGFSRDPSSHASTLLNRPAPSFALHSIDGKPISLASLRGHPVVLNFYASWCPGCKQEHPYLLDAWNAFSPRGVRFVGVEFEDTASDLRSYMRRYGGGWPTLEDPNQQTAISFGVSAPPETFFIDRQGVVRYKATGAVSAGVLAQQIDRLLGSAK